MPLVQWLNGSEIAARRAPGILLTECRREPSSIGHGNRSAAFCQISASLIKTIDMETEIACEQSIDQGPVRAKREAGNLRGKWKEVAGICNYIF